MLIKLTNQEIRLLNDAGIDYAKDQEYTADAVLGLAEDIYSVEASWAQNDDEKSLSMADKYAYLAEKVKSQILE